MRTISILLNVLFAYCSYAQTMTIHYKNGQNVKFNVESIDFIDFQERSEGGTTVSKGEAVDLGLSVLWASHNIGANSPEQIGDNFAWGETTTKSVYNVDNYAYYDSASQSYIDIGIDIGGTEFDAAHVIWGGNWRMPTWNEFTELRKNCEWKWVNYNGVNGYKVTGKNGNSIFIAPPPKPRLFWASHINDESVENGSSRTAASFIIQYDKFGRTVNERWFGNFIRPVMSK